MTPKFIVLINVDTLKYDAFHYDEPGPLPPVIGPPGPDEPKDMPPDDKKAREILPPRPLARKKTRPPFSPN
jgi:hypothetical protein